MVYSGVRQGSGNSYWNLENG